ncbi:hypothetical protein BRC83_01140 [Halobacteriales archaeon QS_1_68_17]|nr:MAG: hypothetical protein BRC83_01140 [Halobacteriales archaeon QS_1_68_17]
MGTSPLWGFGSMLLLVLVVAGVGSALYRGLDGEPRDRALEELRLAYARGELSDEEYEERRDRLERDRLDENRR